MQHTLKYLLSELIIDSRLDTSLADLLISGVSCDSRSVKSGEIFFAIPGAKSDGLAFAEQAISAGAVAIVVELNLTELKGLNLKVPTFSTNNIRKTFTLVLDRFYNNPSSNKLCLGVTGTNGKTSTTWILSRLLALLGKPTTLVGTLGIGQVEKDLDLTKFIQTNNTTPGPELLLKYLHQDPAPATSIEATSQGLAQSRTSSINWDAAIFTNLTRDHLDLHGSFEEYGLLKAKLFSEELALSNKKNKVAIINIDDEFGSQLFDKIKNDFANIKAYSLSFTNCAADIFCISNAVSPAGLEFKLKLFGEEHDFKSALVGQFNLWNLSSSIATLVALGFPIIELQKVLPLVESVPGRLEHFSSSGINIYVDYAHTPDALDSVQKSLLELNPNRLITVFGCGGDRDRGKRPIMAESVAKFSDIAIVTSDNPRSEEPSAIADEIECGLVKTRLGFSWKRILDRDEAIKEAIQIARPGDIILVAGKGHEDYQEVKGVKYPFDDREVVRSALLNTK